MKKNADGPLTIRGRNTSPGLDNLVYWLPAPSRPGLSRYAILLAKETPPSIPPPGTGDWKPTGVLLAS
ncbi:MAG: hypothetical protein P4M15_04760 [Alphaproteobacteria bacterium]|nr:hypothetical protein [Alphaproteobacteria bacterium]